MEKDLFNLLPEKLFRPLASKNCRLHWMVLSRLYTAIFDEEIEESEYGHAREFVIDNIEQTVSQYGHLWIEKTEEEAGDIRSQSNLVYYKLRDAGWFNEKAVAYNFFVSMPPRVSQVLSELIHISEERSLMVGGGLKNMRALVRDIYEEPEGEAGRFIEMVKDAKRFSRHLNSIRGAIFDLYENIKGNVPAREIVQSFFEKFLRKIFIKDYANVKTRDNPLSIRDELLSTVNSLRYNDEKRSVLIAGYKELFPDEVDKAEYYFEQDLSALERVFSGIEHQLDAIDAMQLRYSRRVDTVIEYHTRSPLSIGKELRSIIDVLVRHEKKDPDYEVRMPLNYSEVIGEARFQTPRQKRLPPPPTFVVNRQISEEVKEKLARERVAREAVQVNDEALLSFLDAQLKQHRTLETQDFVIQSVRDYFCLLHIQRLAQFPKWNKQTYRKALSHYRLTPTNDWADNAYISSQKVIVTRVD